MFQADSIYHSKKVAINSIQDKKVKANDIVTFTVAHKYQKSLGSSSEMFLVLKMIKRDDGQEIFRLGNNRGLLKALKFTNELNLCKKTDLVLSSLSDERIKWEKRHLEKLMKQGRIIDFKEGRGKKKTLKDVIERKKTTLRLCLLHRQNKIFSKSQWLCDLTINAFLHMFQQNMDDLDTHMIDSLYFTEDGGKRNMLRNTKLDKLPQGVFSYHKLVFVINENIFHWTFVVVNFERNEIEYLDTFNCRRTCYIDLIKRNIETEWKTLCQHDTAVPVLTPNNMMPIRGLPSQRNGHD